jgi:ubiquinol-cytochrome c reductase iron-sulfur subunit
MQEKRAQLLVGFWLCVSIVASGVFALGYALNLQNEVLGAGLGMACMAIACALIVWSRHLMPEEQVEDEHHSERSSDAERETAADYLDTGLQLVARRKWLLRLGIAAASALGLVALFPFRSWGFSPKGRVGLTDWRGGAQLVTEDGVPIRADDIDPGGMVTAFPKGYVGHDDIEQMGLDAIVVVRVDPTRLRLPPERSSWAPQGCLAYSKICTHLGCPLGLYRQASQELMCPCHQSVFNVLDGGTVMFGPASRSLPQLPLEIADDGTLIASGPMSDYVGADNWNYGQNTKETVKNAPEASP